jgi:hypothetical protein
MYDTAISTSEATFDVGWPILSWGISGGSPVPPLISCRRMGSSDFNHLFGPGLRGRGHGHAPSCSWVIALIGYLIVGEDYGDVKVWGNGIVDRGYPGLYSPE